MDELLQKLLESEILTEDTKKQLDAAIKTKLNEAKVAAKLEVEKEVRAQLAEQWVEERDRLVEAIDSKVSDFLVSEVAELKGDIERFRDLEAEYAEKVVENKRQLSEQLKKDMGELVDKLDNFLEIRLNAEINELKEDINVVRKQSFGKKLFEAFAEEFKSNYNDEDSAVASLRETEKKLSETLKVLSTKEKRLADLERSNKLREVLAPLTGRSREIMSAILKNTSTGQLEEGYKTFIGRVLKETVDTTPSKKSGSEKEGKVLAEQKVEKPAPQNTKVRVATGDSTVNESHKPGTLTESQIRMQRLAGITSR